jgi:hypothetical protein
VTSPSWRRAAEAALLGLLLALPASASAENFVLFPESEQVFRQLIGDPRHIGVGASYYRLNGQDTADAALGHSWGLAQWENGGGAVEWQTNLEAMAYSRFIVGGGINQFETVDFLVNLPLAVRRGMWSGRALLYHQSSHLGDDFIRRTGQQGFRYSVEGLQTQVSLEPFYWLRVYGGGNYRLHTIPSPARWSAQYGFELTSRDFDGKRRYPRRFFIAQDFQNREDVGYNLNSNTEIGVIFGAKGVKRVMRVFAGYFQGHSPYGQFFSRKEHYLDLGVSFHL